MQINDHDVSNQEILEAVNQFATHVEGRFTTIDERFDRVDERFDRVDERFDRVDERFDRVESDISGMKSDITRIEASMVTKAYLDEKLADLRGDLVVLTRKEDSKLRELVNILREKNLLNDQDVKRLVTMEPFAQLIV